MDRGRGWMYNCPECVESHCVLKDIGLSFSIKICIQYYIQISQQILHPKFPSKCPFHVHEWLLLCIAGYELLNGLWREWDRTRDRILTLKSSFVRSTLMYTSKDESSSFPKILMFWSWQSKPHLPKCDFTLDLRINPGRFHGVDLEQYTLLNWNHIYCDDDRMYQSCISQQDDAMKSSRINPQI